MNYEEELRKIEAEKQSTLNQTNENFNSLLNQNSELYANQNAKLDEWKNVQDSLVNSQVQFAQDQYRRGQEETEQDYQKEALASKTAYQKFINPYGAENEQLRQSGLSNAGYAESTKVGAFNTSQMRTAVAREAAKKIKTDFDIKIQEARLKGDTQMAEIALQQMQMQMENAMKQFDYQSSLKLQQMQYGQNLDNTFYGRVQDVYTRQQQEKAQQEAIRQFNEQFSYKQQQDKLAQQNWLREYNLARARNTGGGGSGGSTQLTDTPVNGATPTNATIKTQFYSGPVNPDVKYGTFNTTDSNGIKYQPNNINGSKLSYSGTTVGALVGNIKGSSGASLANQKVWADKSGNLWYWDGSLNKYQPVMKPSPSSGGFSTGGGTGSFGGSGGGI
jgi:hypothetical protein